MALKTLHATLRGHITPAQAAAELGLSERWVKKLVRRLRREGYSGVLRRLRSGLRSAS